MLITVDLFDNSVLIFSSECNTVLIKNNLFIFKCIYMGGMSNVFFRLQVVTHQWCKGSTSLGLVCKLM